MKTFAEIEILSQYKPIVQEKYKVKEMGVLARMSVNRTKPVMLMSHRF